jgi:hypothetical protein
MESNKDWEDVPLDIQSSDQSNKDWEDAPLEEEVEKPSLIESLLRGAASGGTLGFSDEITGAAESLFTDKPYEQARDESRAAYEAAEEANPIAYNVGDVGAGIGTGLLTGGAGIVGRIGTTGLKQGAKELAKLGAKEGAAYGLGQSEADLTEGDVSGAARDVAIGAGAGATLGAGLPMVAKGAGKVGGELLDLVKGTKIGSNFADSFDLSKRGEKFLGEQGKKLTVADSEKAAEELLNQFKRQKKEANRKIKMSLDSNKEPMNLSRELRDIESNLLGNSGDYSEEDLKRIQRLIDSRKVDYQLPGSFTKEGEIPQIDIKGKDTARANLEKSMKKAQAEAEALGQDINFTDPEIIHEANILQTLQTTRNELGEQLPKVRQVDIPADQFQAAQTLVEYKPGDIVKKYKDMNLRDLQNLKKAFQSAGYNEGREGIAKTQLQGATREVDALIESKLSPSYRSAYESANKQWKDSADSAEFFNELKPDFNLDKARLDLADKIRKPSEKRSGYVKEVEERLARPNPELMSRIDDIGVKSRLERSTEGSSLLGFIPTPSAAATYAGAGLGKAASKFKTPVDITNKVLNMPFEGVQNLANKLAANNDDVSQNMSKRITEALSDSTKKDRLLWSLSRQPAFRQKLEEMGLEDLDIDRDTSKEELLNRYKSK